MNLPKAFFYTLVYLLVNAFFGLAPLWFIFEATLFKIKVDYNELIKDGIITFFCIAFIGGISYDYCLAEKKHKSDIFKWFVMAIPFIILSVCGFIFAYLNYSYLSSVNLKSEKDDIFYRVGLLQNVIVTIAVIYCFIIKTFLYSNEKRKSYV